MIWWYLLSVIWTIGYAFLILYIRKIWFNLPESGQNIPQKNIPFISVIIAARNEEKCIANCLKSISENDFPKESYEIIVINDHSTDLTSETIKQLRISNVRLLQQDLNKSGKKAAITMGVNHAQGSIIVLTDADCIAGKKWLSTIMTTLKERQISIITGPVLPKSDMSVLQKFQYLDFASVMGITAFGLHSKLFGLANGANLAFRKEYFYELGGYQGNENIASGDDIFLMEKAMLKNPESVGFLKSNHAIIYTKAENTWLEFLNQRKRWAGKTKAYSSISITILQAYVFMFCFLIVCNLGFVLYGNMPAIYLLLMMIATKLFTDYHYLKTMVNYFGNRNYLSGFIFSFVLYFGHILLSGFFALFPQPYVWKERKIE
ncbi:MAG: glycosyltransferase [Saprospiraceae bacterium]|nr:glycosyltransferase [Saprospiraceae bacterium]